MGDVFPELRERQTQIEESLKREEESFNRTLDKGIALFEAEIARLGSARDSRALPGTRAVTRISGAFAFRLYDEQGFPLDLTELMARERGLTVDTEGFETLMEEQRERARRAQKKSVIEVADTARPFRQQIFSATSTITPAPTLKRSSMSVIERASCSITPFSTPRWADRLATRAR